MFAESPRIYVRLVITEFFHGTFQIFGRFSQTFPRHVHRDLNEAHLLVPGGGHLVLFSRRVEQEVVGELVSPMVRGTRAGEKVGRFPIKLRRWDISSVNFSPKPVQRVLIYLWGNWKDFRISSLIAVQLCTLVFKYGLCFGLTRNFFLCADWIRLAGKCNILYYFVTILDKFDANLCRGVDRDTCRTRLKFCLILGNSGGKFDIIGFEFVRIVEEVPVAEGTGATFSVGNGGSAN